MEPTRLGSTLLVNAETADLQTTFEDAPQAIAIDGSRNFVVVFTGRDTAGWGVFLRRFDLNGQAIDLAGNPSNVDRLVNNAAAPGNQLKPAISMNSRGEFVVAWTSSPGQDGSFSGVYARLYYLDQNNVLQPGAEEIRINDATLRDQFEPSVAINNQGWFVSSYSSFSLDEDPDTFDPYRFDIFIRAYTYNNQGEIQQTAEIPVNLTRLDDQRNSSIAMNDQGDIVVVWTGPDGSGNGIYYRRFKLEVSGSTPQLVPVGDTTGPDTLVNTTTTGVQGAPHVAIDNAGNFVVTWTSTDPINTGDDVFVRRFFYDSNNQLQADEPKLVNVTTSLNQRNSRVAFLPDGGFVVTWTGSSPTTGEDIYSRRFNRLGNPMGTEDYLVNRGTAYTLDNQANAAIATGSDGNYVIVWSGSGPDDSDGGVYAQRFDLAPNRAPNGLSLSNTLVREDAGTGAVVGDLSTTDPDGDPDFIYELVGNDLDNASFVIVNNQLRFKDTVVLDFETRSSYSVRVRTTDLGGLSFEQTFTIEIVNVNEAPTALNLSGSLEVEDGATGDALIIGTISAVDVDDLPRDLTFSLIPGFGNNSAFTIVNSNELRLISSPNYSTNQSFLVGLRVTDSAGNQLDRSFTITVLDRNLPSSRIDLSNTTVAENTLEVGILSTVDPDSNAVFTYELVPIAGSTDDQAFEIVGNQLRFKADQAPDFETKTSYTIEVRSSDRGDTPITQRFTITITDVNEPPTDLIFTRNPNSLNENTTDLVAGTLSTVDPDQNNSFTYSLVPIAGSTDDQAFEIVGNQLRFRSSPDFEAQDAYTVRIRSNDGVNTIERDFTITVQDVNEAPTDITLSNNRIDENATNLLVGTFSTLDPDRNDSFTYELLQTGDFAVFNLNSQGELRLNSAPNFEVKNSYTIQVRSRDQGGLTTTKAFTIDVNDVNEAPRDLTLDDTSIEENTRAGDTIGRFSTDDPDLNDTFTYELVAGAGDTDNNRFRIVNNQLQIQEDIDPVNRPSYSIRVRVRDGGNNTIERIFTLNVDVVNDPPTAISLSSQAIAENATNLLVGTFSTTDPDSTNFVYTLVPIAGSTDDQAFEIVGNQLRFRTSPNFEAQNAYTIEVRSSDGDNAITQRFTITVLDVNEPPTDLIFTRNPNSLNENTTDLVAGTLSTVDPDQNNSFTYSLVPIAGATDDQAFEIVGNQLRFRSSPDFEAQDAYTVRIRSNDGVNTIERDFTITVQDVNEAPTDITLSNNQIDENATDLLVGTFSTLDPDRGDSFTYELLQMGDFAAFSLNSQGELRLNSAPNFEVKNSYTIQVRSRDQGGLTTTKAFTIAVNDVNEPGSAIALSNSTVPENTTAVGTLSTTDPDSGDSFTYELVPIDGSTDDQAFILSGNQLSFRTAPDFEQKNVYTIEIRSTDLGGNVLTQRFTINITNVNEAPTDITLSNNRIDENATNLVVGTLSTTDPDVGNSFTYSLVPIDGSTDDQAFEIVGSELRFRSAPDFEQKNTYTVEIRSFDGSNAITRRFTIIVNDVNEAPTNLQLTGTSVNEGAAIGTEVGTFSAVDPDAGDTISYSLVPNSLPDNAAFSIEGNRLLLQVVPSLSDRTSYTIRVQASDRNNLSTIRDFTIAVQDVENAPTAIALSRESIDENAGENALVGLLSTTDADANEQFTYTLISIPGINDSDAFSLTNVNELRLKQSANFEQKSSYTVRIRTTDRTNRSFEQDFVIAVNDLNEAPTNLTLSNLELDENSAANTVVGILTVTDPDAGEVITYTLPEGGLNDNSVFSIVNTNQLRLNVSPNYEQKASYTVRVVATDRGGLATERTFTIAINDLNEAPTGVNLSNTTVSAIAPANSVVGILSTVDPDAVDTFTYQLVGGLPDNSAFAINGTELRLISPPNPAIQSSYTIRIQTTDQGNLTFEQDFTITVAQANRPPIGLSLDNSSISENATVGTTIGTFTTNDPDTGDSFTYRLVFGFGDSGNSFFTIVGNELRLAQPLDFETRSIHSIRVRTTDRAGASLDQIFNITVLDGNDAPTDLRFSETSISENLAADSVVGSFSSIDPNPGDTFTYSLVEGAGATDNGIFRIDNGQLRILSSPDFETKSSYSIRVRTVDQGGLSFERSLTLTVTDVNEAPSNLTLNGNTVLENLPTNTFVGSFATTDPDLGDTFTYTLVPIDGSTDHTAFTIVGNQLRTAAVFDFEAKSSYQIRVRTTDRSGLSLERDFAIAVQDVNDTPPPTSTIPVIDLNGSAEGINSTASGILGLPIPLVGSAATLTGTSGFQVTSFAVVISNVRDGSAEILAANTAGTPILAAYSADSGTLLLTGTAPLETYLQVLRTVTYQNVALVPNPTPRQILFFANDGANNSAIATTTLSFLPANTINGTPGNDQVAATTLEFDLVRLHAGDDILFSLTQHLLQQDYIDGGSGIDTLTLIAGTGHVTVNVDSNSQVGGVLAGTTVINFERFNFSQFAGTATMTGSNNPTVRDYLAGGSGDDTLFGLAGDDELVGNGGNDLLVGGLGSDRMIGGLGNDTYDVDSPSDVIVEQLNQGIDTVRSAIDYTLGANLENLVLLNGAVVGRGNNLANTLIGNAANNTLAGNAGRDRLFGEAGDDRLLGGRGADRLDGGQGNDVLTGGLGQDSFVLSAAPGAGSDRITDFDPTQDRILFSRTGFETFIRTGRLQANQFRLGSRALDGDDRLIYNRSTGALFFDPDGNGSIAPIQIAVLQNRAALSAANFTVI